MTTGKNALTFLKYPHNVLPFENCPYFLKISSFLQKWSLSLSSNVPCLTKCVITKTGSTPLASMSSHWLCPPLLQACGGGQHPSWSRRVVHARSESRRDPGRLRGEAVGAHAAGCRLRHARRWVPTLYLILLLPKWLNTHRQKSTLSFFN